MNISVPLPPNLEQFLREQLTTGRFRTEDEIILAALRLLKDQTQGRPGREAGTDMTAWPPQRASWEELRDRLTHRPTDRAASAPLTRRSPRGILADLRSNLSLEDFREARRAVWADLPRDSA